MWQKKYWIKKGIAWKFFIVLSCLRWRGKQGMVSFEPKYDQITTRLKGVLCDQFGKKLHPAGCASIKHYVPQLWAYYHCCMYTSSYLLTGLLRLKRNHPLLRSPSYEAQHNETFSDHSFFSPIISFLITYLVLFCEGGRFQKGFWFSTGIGKTTIYML